MAEIETRYQTIDCLQETKTNHLHSKLDAKSHFKLIGNQNSLPDRITSRYYA